MGLELDVTKVETTYTGRPLQLLSYSEKMKNDAEWARINVKFNIDKAIFNQTVSNANMKRYADTVDGLLSTIQDRYDAYNNKLSTELFSYVTNPHASENAKYSSLPARIRMYNILRPNIDLFIGEWNKRPFIYDVVNVDGDDAINSAMMHKTKQYVDNVTQRFINTVGELQKQEGQQPSMPMEEIGNPKTIMSELNLNYKDIKALRGYRALKVLESELKIKEVWRRLFKDWLIAGEVFTFKFPNHQEIEYNRLSPMWVDYDKSNQSPYIEDGDYAVAKFRVSPSEVVDLFYDELTKKQIQEIENEAGLGMTARAFNSLAWTTRGETRQSIEKVDLYLVTWKSKKKIGYMTYPDPVTGEEQATIVDEDYKPNAELGEKVEWFWVNEPWWGWRVNEDKYLSCGPVPYSRAEMNNYSSCKLPINGKRFSDTESENVSVVSLGLSYQVLYIILMFRLEHTIAKSKGKIALLDKKIIPEEDGEEGFFWYGDATSFALVDPDQGTSWFNQYHVLDLSLYEYIKEITGILDFVRSQWDELLGISRQRKGQTTGSDGLGLSEQAIFRSTVISDLIFTGFEEFLQSELQGLLDLSKYAWVDGKKGYYRNDDGAYEMLVLDEGYSADQCGVFVQNMSNYLEKFNQLKANVNALAQRKDVKVSNIIEITMTESLTELKALVKKAEAAEVELSRKLAQDEQQAKAAAEQAQRDWESYKHFLDLDMMERQEDRLDNREYIKASLDKDAGAGIDPYLSTVEQESTKRLDRMEQSRVEDRKIEQDNKWLALEREKLKTQERMNKDNNKTKLKNKTSGEK